MNNRVAIRNLVHYFIALVFLLASCRDKRIIRYEEVINKADRFEILYDLTNKKINLLNQLIPKFKEVLVRNVKPEMTRKLIENVRIDIYTGNKRTGFFTIGYDSINPFVNFNSNYLNFGFHLTYGIGQAIGNIYDTKYH